jgi:hypothetical protein
MDKRWCVIASGTRDKIFKEKTMENIIIAVLEAQFEGGFQEKIFYKTFGSVKEAEDYFLQDKTRKYNWDYITLLSGTGEILKEATDVRAFY